MDAISVKQPWAWALFNGKDVENRTWRTSHRGDLLIHASKTFDKRGYDWILANRQRLGLADVCIPQPHEFPLGAIIGKVKMVDCVTNMDSPWFEGPYGHLYTEHVLFNKPVPYRGGLKFFCVPDELVPHL